MNGQADFARKQLAVAHARLMDDHALQHDLPDASVPSPPAWLKALFEAIRAAWPLLRVVVWMMLGAAACVLLWMLARRLLGLRWPRQREAAAPEDMLAWRPDATVVRGLLREADALAATGCYAEAARLVLHRSIEDVERRRPALVRPATTSRDLAALGALPDAAHAAFAAIAGVVERSLFGERGADAAAWTEAREAYMRFARVDRW